MTVTIAPDAETAPGWGASFLPRRDPPYLVATGAAALVALVVLQASWSTAWLAPAFAGLAVIGALISAGDIITRRIPNKANVAALASVGPLLLPAAAHFSMLGTGGLRLVGGAAIAFVGYLALWIVAPQGMGLGDVKFAPYLGAYLAFFGWNVLARGLIFGFLAQGAFVLVALLTRRLHRTSHVAHGPAMWLGAVAAIALAAP